MSTQRRENRCAAIAPIARDPGAVGVAEQDRHDPRLLTSRGTSVQLPTVERPRRCRSSGRHLHGWPQNFCNRITTLDSSFGQFSRLTAAARRPPGSATARPCGTQASPRSSLPHIPSPSGLRASPSDLAACPGRPHAAGRKGTMAKEICISSTPHETRLAILEDDQLAEIYYERENEYTLAGSIYNGRVTRVLPGMQSAFVDLGLERDAFLYVTDFPGTRRPGRVRRAGKSRGQRRQPASPRSSSPERQPRRGPASSAPIKDRAERHEPAAGSRRREAPPSRRWSPMPETVEAPAASNPSPCREPNRQRSGRLDRPAPSAGADAAAVAEAAGSAGSPREPVETEAPRNPRSSRTHESARI